jgi:FdhD protein
MGRVTQRRKVHKYVLDGSAKGPRISGRHREDVLAVEEPLEIRLGKLSFSVTMRTPGDDFDLVAGFLVSEGVIWSAEQLVSLRFCAGEDENGVQTFNVVEAQLRPDVTCPPPAGTSTRPARAASAARIPLNPSGSPRTSTSPPTLTVPVGTLAIAA